MTEPEARACNLALKYRPFSWFIAAGAAKQDGRDVTILYVRSARHRELEGLPDDILVRVTSKPIPLPETVALDRGD